MKNTLFIISLLISINLNSQNAISKPKQEISFENKIYTVTTLIISKDNNTINQGTGFFYTQLPDSINLLIKPKIWLISNKHILFPKNVSPENLYIHLRKPNIQLPVKWEIISIENSYLKKHTKILKDTTIDVAALDVTKYITPNSIKFDVFTLNKHNLIKYNDWYKPEVGDDILSIGYPKTYYDRYNKFPTVKNGIIASKYGSNYNGKHYFIIDAKLFPGSSGSLIIIKPKSIVMVHGMPYPQQEKKILFLGIYSGEHQIAHKTIKFNDMTITKIDKFDTGIVWYADLVEELIR